MGTNYYHRTNICLHCIRYDENHIGKSSGGWTLYCDEVSFEDFVKLVESKKDEKNNHTEYCKTAHPLQVGMNWIDDEGNSFSEGEFS